MSTQLNTYVIRGVLFDWETARGDPDSFEKLEPYMDSAFKGIHHHDGLCVICDGMNGKYVAIGKVLHKTRNYEGFDEPIPLISEQNEIEEQAMSEQIGELIGVSPPPEIGWYVISHYR